MPCIKPEARPRPQARTPSGAIQEIVKILEADPKTGLEPE